MGWQKVAEQKRTDLVSRMPAEWRLSEEEHPSVSAMPNATLLVSSYLHPSEVQITESATSDLLKNLQSGELTSQEVVLAFCHRAALAHQFTKCLSEVNFDDALRRAKELDKYRHQHGRTVGPLHGLPVSFMDRYNIEGLESSCGFISWLGKRKNASDESALVKSVRGLGAIPFCKTNMPMSMMVGETTNNIVGTTVNPFNRNLSAGGACGGEGALLGLKGSPLGFATEMAGSTRIPSAFNNLYGLKASEGRLPASGLQTILSGLPVASGSIGIMAAHAQTLKEAFKMLLESSPWQYDMDVIELPWREEKYDSICRRKNTPGRADGKLIFGMMEFDGHVRPHPNVLRALRMVGQALQKVGYEIVEWAPPGHSTAAENLFRLFGSTSGKPIRDAINASKEPPIPQLKTWYEQGDVECSPTTEFWDLCSERNKYRSEYAEYWTATSDRTRSGRQIDGIIMPVAPSSAVREGEFQYYAYSAIANVLDYTAVTFPVTFGDADVDVLDQDQPVANELDSSIKNSFRSEDIHGLPVGLQIVCQRQQEERALALVEVIVDALELEI